PVVDELAPQLPFRMGDVGRGPGDVAVLEEVGMGADVGAVRSDVDRHVADQPDPALGRVGAEPAPLSLEADLVGHRAGPGEALPVLDPVRAATADADVYGDPNASGGPSGRICHQLWPASASQSTKSYASDPRRPLGSDVGCSSTPLERAARNTSPVLTELTVVAKGDEDEG